jgi:hypothetical protein
MFQRFRQWISDSIDWLKNGYHHDRLKLSLRFTTLLLLVYILLIRHTFWQPDTLLAILLLVGIVFGRAREFVVRFVPFMVILMIYDALRGLLYGITQHVNWWPMINFDRWLGGGQLIGSRLQALLWHGHLEWYSFYFYLLYSLHFVTPIIFGLILWKYRSRLYWPFVWSILGASFLAFVTFIVFPAAPPWMAVEHGLITEPLRWISSDIWSAMGMHDSIQIVYNDISADPVAAVPSLHAIYPTIEAAFIIAAFSWRRAWWIIFYPISIFVAVIYLGEHYIFDVILSLIYVTITLFVVRYCYKRYRARHQAGVKSTN